MEITSLEVLLRDPWFFVLQCFFLDLLLGDPAYRLHPIRLTGMLLTATEKKLRSMGWEGRAGGFLLFVILAGAFLGVHVAIVGSMEKIHWALAWLWELYLGYSLLCLRDLIDHGRRIGRATRVGNLEAARDASGRLVGRDLDKMDLPACNRAAVESLSENLVDGVTAPLFYFLLFGLPGLVIFKIASTMDSMVGYKNEAYLRFGWFGARLDDFLNYIPARLTWLLMAFFASILPGFSGRAAFEVGLRQHALVPGPNAGWSEAAAAGALKIRLAGPLWRGGALVNTIWLGRENDPEGAAPRDVYKMILMDLGVTVLFLALFMVPLFLYKSLVPLD